MSLFSKYSLNNLFLIARQRPDARRVAGFQTWRKLGRCVRKGEKGMAIIAPLVRRKSDEESEHADDERVIAGFKVAQRAANCESHPNRDRSKKFGYSRLTGVTLLG
jgi:hypothetical protein